MRLALGLMWGATAGAVYADEAPDSKLARLEIRFDQKAHNAAVAAKNTAAAADRETDVPPVGVLRLPKYVVTEERIRLEEREMLTGKGRVELAKKRYLAPMYQKTVAQIEAVATLLHNPLGGWAPNGPEALAIYEDFQQKRRNEETKDLTELAAFGDRMKKKAPIGKQSR